MSLDPCMPLSGSYFHNTGKTPWISVEAETMSDLLKSTNPPEFRTVLGIVGGYEDTTLSHYIGPAYFDFDALDIAEAVEYFKVFLGKLQALGVDLNTCRIFASGGKGFHLEIPQAVFMQEVPDEGVLGLPHIYKEIAFGLYVETLDMRVYSARKGRMWRVPNRQRTNSMYKVPITVDEALNVTAQSYRELVAAPRAFPALAVPRFCPALAAMYNDALRKVVKASEVKAKRKPSKSGELLKARCVKVGAPLPPSILALGAGLIKPKEGIGFNHIAIQLCVAAHALGVSEAELIALCNGLITNHQGDGSRYGTPTRRTAALKEMYRYCEGNPSYEFSMGGLHSIFPESASLNDLKGL